MSDRSRHRFVLGLVVGLIAASLAVIAMRPTVLGLDLKGGVQLVYEGQPSPQTPRVTPAARDLAVQIMRSRVDQLGVSQPEIQTQAGNEISVGLPNVRNVTQAERQVGSTARLYFYDWEANALTPNGQAAASQLLAQDVTALTISQGAGSGPGAPGAGSLPLFDAVRLAARQSPARMPGRCRGWGLSTTCSGGQAVQRARRSRPMSTPRLHRVSTATWPVVARSAHSEHCSQRSRLACRSAATRSCECRRGGS